MSSVIISILLSRLNWIGHMYSNNISLIAWWESADTYLLHCLSGNKFLHQMKEMKRCQNTSPLYHSVSSLY